MLFNIFNKKKKKGNYNDENLYSFNLEEIEEYNKLSREKLNNLKEQKHEMNAFLKEEVSNNKLVPQNENHEQTSSINNIEIKEDIKETEEDNQEKIKEELEKNSELLEKTPMEKNDISMTEDEIIEESLEKITPKKETKPKFSYINLSKETQEIIMNNWQSVDLIQLNKDIEKGEDLINHNYTIRYCDDACQFIKEIRQRYDVVIKYLIGFNNEKHEIFDKTTFGENEMDEWRYLNNYIKLLEKIKKIKK